MRRPVKTKVEELPDNRVRLEVEVPPDQVQHAFEHAASDLARTMRVPGFRKGKKVPLPVIAARVGREALAAEAVRSHIDGWFWDAAARVGVQPVDRPEVEWDELPAQSTSTFTFRATVPVPPRPEVADWTTLEVGRPEPEVPAELVDEELERLRKAAAELTPVCGRPAAPGDAVVVDIVASEDGKPPTERRDVLVEIGAGVLAEELEQALPGMREGDEKTVTLALPEGRTGTVTVAVREIREKVLPSLDDELARSVSEFDTLAELRADIEASLRRQLDEELEARFREDALDALVDASKFEGIEPLVERRTAALLRSLAGALERRGVQADAYLRMTGQSPEQLQEQARAEAERAVKRELVLEAIAAERGIEVGDAEVEELVRSQAVEAGDDPDATVARLREQGAFETLRGDLKLRKALDEVAAGVKRISMDLARAREKLWTPEKEKAGSGMKIWTPGGKE